MYFVIQKRHGTGGWSNAIIVKPDLNAAMLQLHG